MRTAGLTVFGFAWGLAVACGTDAECPAGSEGCPCTADYNCLTGLACLSEYCVDPQAAADDGPSEEGGDSDSDPSSFDNVAACEDWIDATDCSGVELSDFVDCGGFAATQCDIASYFDCLTDNTDCSGDSPFDMSGWANCTSELTCD